METVRAYDAEMKERTKEDKNFDRNTLGHLVQLINHLIYLRDRPTRQIDRSYRKADEFRQRVNFLLQRLIEAYGAGRLKITPIPNREDGFELDIEGIGI